MTRKVPESLPESEEEQSPIDEVEKKADEYRQAQEGMKEIVNRSTEELPIRATSVSFRERSGEIEVKFEMVEEEIAELLNEVDELDGYSITPQRHGRGKLDIKSKKVQEGNVNRE